ncbi:MAG: AI-2E family transporter [Rhodobacteraceae bacterium]|nr:AI-2E family transporter [Paracoccaceae bacterium]
MSLRDFFFITALAVLIGYVMVVGQAVLLPIVVAVMLAYVLVGAVETMRGWPVMGALPRWMLFSIALAIFGLAITSIGLVAIANLRSIATSAPQYQENILALLTRGAEAIGLRDMPTWGTLRALTLDRIDLGTFSIGLLGSLAAIGGYTVLIITYVAFLVAERGSFDRKMTLIFGEGEDRAAAVKVVGRINEQIVTYLFTKTVINIVLGLISYVLMLILGIDNAVFWAFLIAIFNYIPYVGSLVGVGIVVLYSAAQTGALRPSAAVLVVLTAAQVYVGNWFEPRMMARSLNLSPFVVLAALVVWSSLWGLAGAIIAVPMTSILMIILAAFRPTRPIPIMLSRDGRF